MLSKDAVLTLIVPRKLSLYSKQFHFWSEKFTITPANKQLSYLQYYKTKVETLLKYFFSSEAKLTVIKVNNHIGCRFFIHY